MTDAFCHELKNSLIDAGENPNERAARHQITVLAEMTRDLRKAATTAGVADECKEAIAGVIDLGKATAAAVKRICEECDDLYAHGPPETTTTTCAYCTAEREYEEGRE